MGPDVWQYQQQRQTAQQVLPGTLHQPSSAASWKLHPSRRLQLDLGGHRRHVLLD